MAHQPSPITPSITDFKSSQVKSRKASQVILSKSFSITRRVAFHCLPDPPCFAQREFRTFHKQNFQNRHTNEAQRATQNAT